MVRNRLSIGSGYTLDRVVISAIDRNHYPKIDGCIISGPKGGQYVMDEYGRQHLFRKLDFDMIGVDTLDNNGDILKGSITYDINILNSSYYKTNEDRMRAFAKACKANFVKRTEVIKFVSNVVSKK